MRNSLGVPLHVRRPVPLHGHCGALRRASLEDARGEPLADEVHGDNLPVRRLAHLPFRPGHRSRDVPAVHLDGVTPSFVTSTSGSPLRDDGHEERSVGERLLTAPQRPGLRDADGQLRPPPSHLPGQPSLQVPVVDEEYGNFASHTRLLLSLPTLVTWNARGLFSADAKLQARKLSVFGALCRDHSIVCVQECHGTLVDWEGLVPHSVCFTSRHPLGARGGVAMVVKEQYVADKHFEFEELVPGRVISVTFTYAEMSFTLYTLHLEGESHDHRSRLELLGVIGNAVNAAPLIL